MRISLKVQEDQCWVLMQFKSKSVLKVQRLFGTLLLNNNKVQCLVGTTTTTVHLHRNLSNDEEGEGGAPKTQEATTKYCFGKWHHKWLVEGGQV